MVIGSEWSLLNVEWPAIFAAIIAGLLFMLIRSLRRKS